MYNEPCVKKNCLYCVCDTCILPEACPGAEILHIDEPEPQQINYNIDLGSLDDILNEEDFQIDEELDRLNY